MLEKSMWVLLPETIVKSKKLPFDKSIEAVSLPINKEDTFPLTEPVITTSWFTLAKL